LPINLHHGQLAGSLPGPHRDPFEPNAGRAGAPSGPRARLERDHVRPLWSPAPVVSVIEPLVAWA
jgi:hypothetical protein